MSIHRTQTTLAIYTNTNEFIKKHLRIDTLATRTIAKCSSIDMYVLDQLVARLNIGCNNRESILRSVVTSDHKYLVIT